MLKILRYSIFTGVFSSGLLAMNVYVLHQGWLWLAIYIAPPIAVMLFIMRGERKLARFFVRSYIYLFGQAVIIALFELPIYQFWKSAQTPAGSTYTWYQMDAFYPHLGLIFIAILPVLFGFWLWVYSRGTLREKPAIQSYHEKM
ncbi:MAG: hypothetical protein AAB445_01795 [Patescibacteria group bacterium]